jgi:hypothetical protein
MQHLDRIRIHWPYQLSQAVKRYFFLDRQFDINNSAIFLKIFVCSTVTLYAITFFSMVRSCSCAICGGIPAIFRTHRTPTYTTCSHKNTPTPQNAPDAHQHPQTPLVSGRVSLKLPALTNVKNSQKEARDK